MGGLRLFGGGGFNSVVMAVSFALMLVIATGCAEFLWIWLVVS